MSQPKRIQLRRTKGWRKPEGAIVVARPSKWGNPYWVGAWSPSYLSATTAVSAGDLGSRIETVQEAVDLFAKHVAPWLDLSELRGLDLACWCPLDQPCHADVLLELANAA